MSVFYGNYANGVVMSTRTRLYFIGLSEFCAQPSWPTTCFLRKRVDSRRRKYLGQKRLKKPPKDPKQPILLGIAVHGECESAPNSALAYSCYKIGRACQPDLIIRSWFTFSQIARILRYSARLAYLIASFLKSPHRAFLGLRRGYLRQKERRSRHCQFLSAIPFITSAQPRWMSLFS